MVERVVRGSAIVAVAMALIPGLGPHQRPARPPARIARLPLYFVETPVPRDQRFAYAVHGRRASVLFTATGLVTTLTGTAGEAPPRARAVFAPAPAPPRSATLELEFVDARRVWPVGEDETPAVVSDFTGPREHWRTGLRTYAGVSYRDLWPGIDLVYAGATGRLKYTFVLEPGADPGRIRLAYHGASAVRLDDAGRLVVTTPAGQLSDDPPLAWQDVDGRRVAVAADYVLEGHAYGFRVGPYDASRPLVVDPAVALYAGVLGLGDTATVYDAAVDDAGNAYVTGDVFRSSYDAFVAKVRADGTGLVYTAYIGGGGADGASGIAVDDQGNAYVVGSTSSQHTGTAPFPVVVGPGLEFGGFPGDAFVAKVGPEGTTLVYCGYIGGDGADGASDVAVDEARRAYVVGTTSSDDTTFPATVGPLLSRTGGSDAFVARVAADGTALEYAGFIGGDFHGTIAAGVAVDGMSSAYVTGRTDSTPEDHFPLVIGPDLTYNDDARGGRVDAFVAKIRPDGTGFAYAGYIGGDGWDAGAAVAVDAEGHAVVFGDTRSSTATFPVAVGPDLTHNGDIDAFVAKVRADGSGLDWAGYIGGAGNDGVNFSAGVALDAAGNVYVAGVTNSDETTFPVTGGPDLTHNGRIDAFVATVCADGTRLGWAGYVGGSRDDPARGMAVDVAGNAYIAGSTNSDDFPTVVGPILDVAGADGFVAKIATVEDDPCGPVAASTTTTSTGIAGTSTTTSTAVVIASTTTTAAVGGAGTSTTSTTLPPEICGNCVDDDEDGLVDFEDEGACCLARHEMTLERARMKPRGEGSQLRLRSAIAGAGALDPRTGDVFVQIRRNDDELLCAVLPAASFTRRKAKAFRFADPRHGVTSARGIDRLVLRPMQDQRARLTLAGSRVALEIPPQGALRVTFGFRGPAGDRCASIERALRSGRKQSIRYP